jgi:hypothetical protein
MECDCCDKKAVHPHTQRLHISDITLHRKCTRTHLSQKGFMSSCHATFKQANEAICNVAGIVSRDWIGEIGYACFASNSLKVHFKGPNVSGKQVFMQRLYEQRKHSVRYRVRSNHFATSSYSSTQTGGVNNQDLAADRSRFYRASTC